MQKNAKDERMNHLFSSHPNTDRFYFTSDNTPFFEKHHAEAHASSLEVKTVVAVTRGMHEVVEAAKAKLRGETVPETSGAQETENGEAQSKAEGSSSETPGETQPAGSGEATGQPAGETVKETAPAKPAEASKAPAKKATAPKAEKAKKAPAAKAEAPATENNTVTQ